MKMFGPKSLSFYVFNASLLFALASLIALGIIIVSLSTGNFILEGDMFRIALPFTETSIMGAYHSGIIVLIVISFIFYIVFLILLSNIFKVFKNKTIFTDIAVKRLNHFAFWNLCSPLIYLIIHIAIEHNAVFTHLPYALLHFVLGLIILFISALFEKGGKLQQEIDLTI